MNRLALLGGTFDPIHCGHLDIARAAREALGLDQVWLVPSHVPPHRHPPHASAAHRFAMAVLSAQDDAGMLVSDIEMLDAAPSYTSGTLAKIADTGLTGSSVFFITGADAFREIETWKDFPAILEACHFVVVSRPGAPVASLRGHLPALAARMVDLPGPIPAAPAILLVEAVTADVSSTQVRQKLAEGGTIEGMVPATVAAYIRKQALYQSQQAPLAQQDHTHA
jgi:nicotinate-nucleotide adenylyltransferase